MKYEFIHDLNLKNLLWLHNEIENAIADKKPDEILEYIKKLEEQKKSVRNNKEYEYICKEIAIIKNIIKLDYYESN